MIHVLLLFCPLSMITALSTFFDTSSPLESRVRPSDFRDRGFVTTEALARLRPEPLSMILWSLTPRRKEWEAESRMFGTGAKWRNTKTFRLSSRRDLEGSVEALCFLRTTLAQILLFRADSRPVRRAALKHHSARHGARLKDS